MQTSSQMDKEFLEQLTKVIEQNLEKEDFGVEQLASELGMSRITLHRKVKAIVKKSVSEFIRETRLKHANRLLQQKTGTVSEIAYKVGFSSVPYFSRSFRKFYGYTPGEVLKGLHPPTNKLIKQNKKLAPQLIVLFIILLLSTSAFIIYTITHKKYGNTQKTLAAFILQDSANSINENAAKMNMVNFELISRLEEIPEISIAPFSSIQNYPFGNKQATKIGKDLKVDYVLYGKAMESGAELILYFELINTSTEELLWNTSSPENWEFATTGDLINILNNLITEIVENLKIELSPKNKERIVQQPDNLLAYEKYLEAVELMNRSDVNRQHVKKAKQLLEESIELNPNYSKAYFMMARVYLGNLYYGPNPILSGLYRDTAKIWLDKALLLDSTNYKALLLTKRYYEQIKDYKQVEKLEELISKSHKTIKNYSYYINEFAQHKKRREPCKMIQAYYNYTKIKPGDIETPWWILQNVYDAFNRMGFPKEARIYAKRFYRVQRDTTILANTYHCIILETHHGNFETALEIAEKNSEKNKADLNALWLNAYCSMRNRDYSEACSFLDKMENMSFGNVLEMISSVNGRLYTFPLGYSYLMNGQEEKGKYYLNRLIEKYETEISTNSAWEHLLYPYFEAAMVWSALGNSEKSFDYLNQLLEMDAPIYLWFVIELKSNPMFDTIKDTDEYERILNLYENRYQEEHNKIEELLAERKKMGKPI